MPYLSVLGSNFEKTLPNLKPKPSSICYCQFFMQNLKSFYSVQKCLIWVFFLLELKKKLFSCMKPPPSNPSIFKTLLRNKNAKIWDQRYCNWVLLNCNLKMIFSYLKSASSNLFNCKISWKKQKSLIWVFLS